MPRTEAQLNQTHIPPYEITPNHPGLVVCLLAISAGGKTFVGKTLYAAGDINPQFTEVNRCQRSYESDTPYDHRFVTSEDLARRYHLGRYILVHAEYGNLYGLPGFSEPALPDKPTLILGKPSVVPALREVVPCMAVYAIESRDSLTTLAKRMRSRGQTEEDIEIRVACARAEEKEARKVVDPERLFIAEGHPKEVLPRIRAALCEDFERHEQSCAFTETSVNL